MFSFEILPNLQEILNKLSKKDKLLYGRILRKIEEVIILEILNTTRTSDMT